MFILGDIYFLKVIVVFMFFYCRILNNSFVKSSGIR